ncbi:hypothetical protein Tco_1319359 [Tanacetum coccineum]
MLKRGDRGLEMLGTGFRDTLGRSAEGSSRDQTYDRGRRVNTRDSRTRISQRVTMDSQRVDLLMGMEIHRTVNVMTIKHQVTRLAFQMQHAELAALRETDRRRQDQMADVVSTAREAAGRARTARTTRLDTRSPEASGNADSHI